MLNGSNFKVWKDTVEIVLGCMDLDIALQEEKLTSTPKNLNEVKIKKWERSNRMSIMIMKRSIPEAFRGSNTEDKDAKQFLKDVEKFFTKKFSAHMALSSQYKRKRDTTADAPSQQKKAKKQDQVSTCFFCKKVGHMKKDCTKYATWRVKKSMILTFVCSEASLSYAPVDTWWVDFAATTHVSVTM